MGRRSGWGQLGIAKMARVIAYDIARLFLAPLSQSPRGIDRVDLSVARHFFADSGSLNVGILPTPWGVRVFDSVRVRRGLDHIESLWAERDAALDDPCWPDIVRRLNGSTVPDTPSHGRGLTVGDRIARLLAELRATGFSFGRPVRSTLPRDAIYLNIGQIGLAVPQLHYWLEARRDVTAVHMLHDVIPLVNPEMVDPSSRRHHQRMVQTVARHADGMIVTTDHAQEQVATALRRLGRAHIETCVRRLPLPEAFARPQSAHPDLAGVHYFVVCATVEPRKNLDLLFAVWQRLVTRMGKGAPHLVIAGSRGFNADEILAPLAQGGLLRSHVHHVSGLSTPALAQLMLGAAAILCPSHAEGFGLPLLEANSLHLPTIASDIAAHREIAANGTLLLPPDDIDRWEAAIRNHGPGAQRQTPAIPPALSVDAYCRDIDHFLTQCADIKGGGSAPASLPGAY